MAKQRPKPADAQVGTVRPAQARKSQRYIGWLRAANLVLIFDAGRHRSQ